MATNIRLIAFVTVAMAAVLGPLQSLAVADAIKPGKDTLYAVWIEKHGQPEHRKRPQWLDDYLTKDLFPPGYAGGLIPLPLLPKADYSYGLDIVQRAPLWSERLIGDGEFRQGVRRALNYLAADATLALAGTIDNLIYIEPTEDNRYALYDLGSLEGLLVLAAMDQGLEAEPVRAEREDGQWVLWLDGKMIAPCENRSFFVYIDSPLRRAWHQRYGALGGRPVPDWLRSFAQSNLMRAPHASDSDADYSDNKAIARLLVDVVCDESSLARRDWIGEELLLLRSAIAYLTPELTYEMASLSDCQPSWHTSHRLFNLLEGFVSIACHDDATMAQS